MSSNQRQFVCSDPKYYEYKEIHSKKFNFDFLSNQKCFFHKKKRKTIKEKREKATNESSNRNQDKNHVMLISCRRPDPFATKRVVCEYPLLKDKLKKIKIKFQIKLDFQKTKIRWKKRERNNANLRRWCVFDSKVLLKIA